MAADKPLTIAQMQALFIVDDGLDIATESYKPSKAELEAALEDIQLDSADRGFELQQVASGWRFQVKQEFAPWVGRLWEEKPQRYSRALLETLALIAYRQPITRGEIEEIRGVAVSSQIIKTLSERQWVKVIGHKDVPGRPSMYATTKEFLDYFNLSSLEQLPTLAELRDLDSLNSELDLAVDSDSASADATTADQSSDASANDTVDNDLHEDADIISDHSAAHNADDNAEESAQESEEESAQESADEIIEETMYTSTKTNTAEDAENLAAESMADTENAAAETGDDRLIQAADIFKSS